METAMNLNNEHNENKKQKKHRKHVILSIPVLAAVVLFIYTFVVESIGSGIGEAAFGSEMAPIGMILSCVIMHEIHKLWFRSEYKGSFCTEHLLEKNILIPVAIFVVVDVVLCLTTGAPTGIHMPTLSMALMAIGAGICEEIVDRVIIMTTLLRVYVKKNTYMPVLIITSIIFGVSHLMNLCGGAALDATLLQILSAGGAGLLLAAIFLRTGNILYSIAVHAIHDLACAMVLDSMVLTASVRPVDWAITVGFVAFEVAITVWLLKGHKDEIIAIWKEIWSVED